MNDALAVLAARAAGFVTAFAGAFAVVVVLARRDGWGRIGGDGHGE